MWCHGSWKKTWRQHHQQATCFSIRPQSYTPTKQFRESACLQSHTSWFSECIQADMQMIYCRIQAAHRELFVFVAGVNHPFASQDECHHWHDCNINSNLWRAFIVRIVRQAPAPRKSSRCWCRDSEVSLKVCLVRIDWWSILIQSLNPCSNNSNKELHVELSLIAGWPNKLKGIKLHIQHACTTYLGDTPKWWNTE